MSSPSPSLRPRLTGATVFGVRPGAPFHFALTACGEKPIRFECERLPRGLTLDAASGRITGSVRDPGDHVVRVAAANAHGRHERDLRLAVGETLSLTPPMGWNSWNCWGDSVDADKVRRSARGLAEHGLADHGWSYLNIDDGWQGRRHPGGALQPNEKFPDMAALAEDLHGMGLRLGIYSTPWKTSYAGFAGGAATAADGGWIPPESKEWKERQRHFQHAEHKFEPQDACQWARWGIDYLKYDWFPNDHAHTRRMAEALRACGRDIVFSLSNTAPLSEINLLSAHANLWRTTGDIRDQWRMAESEHHFGGIADIWDRHASWRPFQRPGHWNDPDMLVLGRVGWGPEHWPSRLTREEQRTHMSLWCLWSAPLLLGCPLDQLDPFTLELITNEEVIDLDQDALGDQGRRVWTDGAAEVVRKELAGGGVALGLFNRGETPRDVPLLAAETGLEGRWRLRDLWARRDLGEFEKETGFSVPARGVILLRAERA